MQRKTEIIIAVIIIVALVVLLFLWFNRQAAPVTAPVKTNTTVTTNNVTPTPDPAPPVTVAAASASTVARVFVERFGSYSTESGYTNIDDVMALTTVDLQGRLRSLVEEAQKNVDGQYYGVSTRLMSSKAEATSETAITFKVVTQRQESFDSPANTSVRYQDIRIVLTKSGEDWLVSDFTWL